MLRPILEKNQNPELLELSKALQSFNQHQVFILNKPQDVDEEKLKRKIGILKEFGESQDQQLQKKAFIVNGGEHWDVYTTEDGGASFTKNKIRGDGYCGLTSAIFVHNFFNDTNKIGVLEQLKAGDQIHSWDGKKMVCHNVSSGCDLEGQYYIKSTKGDRGTEGISEAEMQDILTKLKATDGLKNNIGKLSDARGYDRRLWLLDEDLRALLESLKCNETFNEFDLKIHSSNEWLEKQKARANFLSNTDPNRQFQVQDLFPKDREFYDCTQEDFQKYSKTLDKFCLYSMDDNQKNDLIKTILRFQIYAKSSETKRRAQFLLDVFILTETSKDESKGKILQSSVETIKDLVQQENIEDAYKKLIKPKKLFEFVNSFTKEGNQPHLEKLPDAFRPEPISRYEGWGIKVNYDKSGNGSLQIAEVFNDKLGIQKDKFITHIGGKTIKQFLQEQKQTSITLREDSLKPDDIDDIYYITHYFRTAKKVKLTLDNNSNVTLNKDNKKVFEKLSNPSSSYQEASDQGQAKTDLEANIKEDLKSRVLNIQDPAKSVNFFSSAQVLKTCLQEAQNR